MRTKGWGLLWLALALFIGAQCAAASEKVTIYLTDAQGSVVAETDAQGNVTYTAANRPYGTQVMGAPQAGPGYTGHINDPNTGLVYMQARYYDPTIGRFLSSDPVSPDPGNLFNFGRYAYANGNPIRFADPFGLYACGSKVSSGDCKKIDGFVNKIHTSLEGLKKGSSDYRSLSAVASFLGSKNDGNGVTIATASLGKNVAGEPGGLKTIKLNMKAIAGALTHYIKYLNSGLNTKEAGVVAGGDTVAHETQHLIDANQKIWNPSKMEMEPQGFPGPHDPGYEMATEKKAYGVEGAFGRGLGIDVGSSTPSEISANALESCQAQGSCP